MVSGRGADPLARRPSRIRARRQHVCATVECPDHEGVTDDRHAEEVRRVTRERSAGRATKRVAAAEPHRPGTGIHRVPHDFEQRSKFGAAREADRRERCAADQHRAIAAVTPELDQPDTRPLFSRIPLPNCVAHLLERGSPVVGRHDDVGPSRRAREHRPGAPPVRESGDDRGLRRIEDDDVQSATSHVPKLRR